MRLFSRIAVYFYVLLISIICGVALLFVFHQITVEDLVPYLQVAESSQDIRMIVGFIALALMVLSLILKHMVIGEHEKERTIAFDNPTGRVSISLVAVEDLVRRLSYRLAEIKEVRPRLVATKRGLEVDLRLVLKTEVNIPEMTARMQGLIKDKIQDTLGVDEAITVRIHVAKISCEKPKSKRGKDDDEVLPEAALPFQGYRN